MNDELAREQPAAPDAHSGQGSDQHSDPSGNNGQRRTRDRTRRATSSQVRAIETIARRQGVNLAALLSGRYEITAPAELSIVKASRLIDELRELAASKGDRR